MIVLLKFHDWLNFGYEFVSSKSANIAHQKACINLLRKLIEIKPGSRIKVSRLNEVIRDEIKVSSLLMIWFKLTLMYKVD